MRSPLVTLTRSAWRSLVAQALGHVREGGGLLVGRRTRLGTWRVEHVTGMTHVRADGSTVEYAPDEKARAREAAYGIYAPLEPVGEWHTHPYGACTSEALEPQISDPDVAEMLEEAIEVVAITYPDPGYQLKMKRDFLIQHQGNGKVCRAEAWVKRDGEAVPVEIRVR